MPNTPSYHIAKTGTNQGKWVTCPATQKCRNGGFHITKTDMKHIREEMKNTLGYDVSMSSITPETAAFFLKKQEETTTKTDQQAQEAGVDLAATRMQNELVSATLTGINQITGSKAKTLEKAREQIIQQYENLGELPTVDELKTTLFQTCTAEDLDLQNITITTDNDNNIILEITETHEAEDEREYNNIIKALKANQKTEPTIFHTPTWEQATQDETNSSDGWDSYDGYYGEPEVVFTTTRTFQIPDPQYLYKKVTKKAQLAHYYPIAKNPNLPVWAISTPILYSNPAADKLVAFTKNTADHESKLTWQLQTAENQAKNANKLLTQKTELQKEITQATETLKTPQPEVIKKAVTNYLADKKRELLNLEPRLVNAQQAGSNEKVAAAKANLQNFKNGELTQEENRLWKEATHTWLANRFPSHYPAHRESEARKWVKEHPEAIETIKQHIKHEKNM